MTDVALVSSLRDGMNLVSYEYVACQKNRAGVLILSEFAGAAQSLGAGGAAGPYEAGHSSKVAASLPGSMHGASVVLTCLQWAMTRSHVCAIVPRSWQHCLPAAFEGTTAPDYAVEHGPVVVVTVRPRTWRDSAATPLAAMPLLLGLAGPPETLGPCR